jgi:hypothetical protein
VDVSGAEDVSAGAPDDELSARLDDSYAPELLPLVVNASWMEMLLVPVVVVVLLGGGRPNGGGGRMALDGCCCWSSSSDEEGSSPLMIKV